MQHSDSGLDSPEDLRPATDLGPDIFYGFVLARAAHAVAYATRRSHEIHATFYTIGSLIVITMAVLVLTRI